ncbi:MAG TPA: hypothetical protein VK969_04275 [Acidimicrobiia bacterium]|nr:hypothetical protein [Acidimicrobiia bacterium]
MKALWAKLPPTGRVAFLAGIAAAAVSLVATARHDLARRDTASIRGNREVWDRATRLPGGATAYLIAGRRPA